VLEGPKTLAIGLSHVLEHKRILSVISQDSASGYLSVGTGPKHCQNTRQHSTRSSAIATTTPSDVL